MCRWNGFGEPIRRIICFPLDSIEDPQEAATGSKRGCGAVKSEGKWQTKLAAAGAGRNEATTSRRTVLDAAGFEFIVSYFQLLSSLVHRHLQVTLKQPAFRLLFDSVVPLSPRAATVHPASNALISTEVCVKQLLPHRNQGCCLPSVIIAWFCSQGHMRQVVCL